MLVNPLKQYIILIDGMERWETMREGWINLEEGFNTFKE